MRPQFPSGSLVSVDIFEQPRDLAIDDLGEVILLRLNGEWVIHRCVLYKGKLFSKGDWSPQFDKPSQVWGRLVTPPSPRPLADPIPADGTVGSTGLGTDPVTTDVHVRGYPREINSLFSGSQIAKISTLFMGWSSLGSFIRRCLLVSGCRYGKPLHRGHPRYVTHPVHLEPFNKGAWGDRLSDNSPVL